MGMPPCLLMLKPCVISSSSWFRPPWSLPPWRDARNCCQHSGPYLLRDSQPVCDLCNSMPSQVDTGALLLALLYIVLRIAAPPLFAATQLGPLLLPVAATAAMALLRIFDPARYGRVFGSGDASGMLSTTLD
jgi:hypothetical protein